MSAHCCICMCFFFIATFCFPKHFWTQFGVTGAFFPSPRRYAPSPGLAVVFSTFFILHFLLIAHKNFAFQLQLVNVSSRFFCWMVRHEEALEHARSAVFYGQEREEAGSQRGRGGGWNGRGESLRGAGSRRARLATLAVSYYNLAVELEYTRRYQACLRWWVTCISIHSLV